MCPAVPALRSLFQMASHSAMDSSRLRFATSVPPSLTGNAAAIARSKVKDFGVAGMPSMRVAACSKASDHDVDMPRAVWASFRTALTFDVCFARKVDRAECRPIVTVFWQTARTLVLA